jgi:hypothetical protein
MVRGDNNAITTHLSAFKNRELIRYDKVLSIPTGDRIPALISSEAGRGYVAQALGGALIGAFNKMNLRKGFTEDQVEDLVGLIMEESLEDNLALEDVLLFLYQLITGKAGRIYDRLDIPSFFELFEVYREKRYKALQEIKYERECNYRSMGDPTRSSDELIENDTAYQAALREYKLKRLHEEGK